MPTKNPSHCRADARPESRRPGTWIVSPTSTARSSGTSWVCSRRLWAPRYSRPPSRLFFTSCPSRCYPYLPWRILRCVYTCFVMLIVLEFWTCIKKFEWKILQGDLRRMWSEPFIVQQQSKHLEVWQLSTSFYAQSELLRLTREIIFDERLVFSNSYGYFPCK